jgi:hypothetical protein
VNLGRETLLWPRQRWARLDRAVHEEARRAGIGASLLPPVGALPSAVSVPADEVGAITQAGAGVLLRLRTALVRFRFRENH